MPQYRDRDEVIVVDYDPDWPGRYQRESSLITETLAGLLAAIEHVGSTAVPGLAAKPIIDIMVGVPDLAAAERCVQPMERTGYEYRGEAGIPGRLFFRKGDPRAFHIHLVEQRSDFWEQHIAFRDLLRARPDVAVQYGALKRELAERYRAQREEYTEAKTPFIQAALEQDGPGAAPRA